MYDNTGIRSLHPKTFLQEGQDDRGDIIDSPRGTLYITTFKNEPMRRETINTDIDINIDVDIIIYLRLNVPLE
jgi:hypothetical protein